MSARAKIVAARGRRSASNGKRPAQPRAVDALGVGPDDVPSQEQATLYAVQRQLVSIMEQARAALAMLATVRPPADPRGAVKPAVFSNQSPPP